MYVCCRLGAMAGCCDRAVRRVQRVVVRCVQAGAAEGGVGRVVRWVVNWARVLVWGSAIGRAGNGRGGRGGGCAWWWLVVGGVLCVMVGGWEGAWEGRG